MSIGIIAGRTKTLVVADDAVDGEHCAIDLIGLTENGPKFKAALFDNGWAILNDTYKEIHEQAELMACKYVHALKYRDAWFHDELKSYGALFWGPCTIVNVWHKVIGTNYGYSS